MFSDLHVKTEPVVTRLLRLQAAGFSDLHVKTEPVVTRLLRLQAAGGDLPFEYTRVIN